MNRRQKVIKHYMIESLNDVRCVPPHCPYCRTKMTKQTKQFKCQCHHHRKKCGLLCKCRSCLRRLNDRKRTLIRPHASAHQRQSNAIQADRLLLDNAVNHNSSPLPVSNITFYYQFQTQETGYTWSKACKTYDALCDAQLPWILNLWRAFTCCSISQLCCDEFNE